MNKKTGKLDKIITDVENYVSCLMDEGVREIESFADVSVPSGIKEIERRIEGCRRCPLYATRLKVVPGQGSLSPEIMFVGEGPGREEDEQGIAFIGAAGKLLTKIIEAMGYRREDVFIANIVKCRPPGNRKPASEEMEACMPFLNSQIAVLRPKAIVALGATALEGLIGPPISITRQRGAWLSFEGIPLMPTFHPSYLLRNPSAKQSVWNDMKAVLKLLGRKPPPRPDVRKKASIASE